MRKHRRLCPSPAGALLAQARGQSGRAHSHNGLLQSEGAGYQIQAQKGPGVNRCLDADAFLCQHP